MNSITVFYIRALLALLVSLSSTAMAMPPHPELAEQIRKGAIAAPFYLQHHAELSARGVNTPERTRSLQDYLDHSLDEDMNILAILMDFSDNGARTPANDFDSLLIGNSRGTLRDYYYEVSYGNLTLTCVNLPGMLGWQRAPQTYSYYVNGQNGFGNYPRNAQRLTEDAVQLVDPIVDFSQYDNDGDGYVDALFIIHAGPGAERSGNDNHIWSHMWGMWNPQEVDGVVADIYSMEPEFWSGPGDMTCGVYAHEMGHSVFGLPDFYDYDGDSEGLGRWSLMAGGSWNGPLGATPAHPDAWGRIEMGFVEPVIVSADIPSVQIPSVQASPVIYRLWTNGQQGQEYFLVENRQQSGYDIGIPGNGVLIYHVDDSRHGNDDQWYPGHTENGHYQVALEQADGLWDLEHEGGNSGDAGDAYPGIGGQRNFTPFTVPDSRSYNETDTRVAVRRISPSSDTMTASLFVGSNPNIVYTSLPDTASLAGNQICIPIRIESNIASFNITNVQFTVSYNSAAAQPTPPYYSITGGLIPASWTVSENHSVPGQTTIQAQGTAALSGQGELLCLMLTVPPGVDEGTTIPLRFTQCQYNTGFPAADTTNGSLKVIAPLAVTTPETLDFGYVRVGLPTVQGLIIRNVGSAPLTVDSALSNHVFVHDFSGPQIILPNAWHPVRVRLIPTALEIYRDTLTIYSDASGGTLVVPIRAEGALPYIDVQPAMLLFDSTGMGEETPRTLIAADTGHFELRLQNAAFSTGDNFRIEPSDWPQIVPGDSSIPLTVYFSPTVLGLIRDTLILTHDAGNAVRIPLEGICRPTDAEYADPAAIPTRFYLAQNYPNPFNPATTIEFGIPSATHLLLRIYDVTGREVQRLVNQTLAPGRYTARWDAHNAAAGVYFIAMTTESFTAIHKAILLK